MPKRHSSGKETRRKVSFELEKNAGEGIEEAVFWRTAFIIARSQRNFEVGSATAIQWNGRSFLVTANHVIDGYSDAELTFGFRPKGTLDRDPWHEHAPLRADQLVLTANEKIIARFRNTKDDLAALEVDPAELNEKVRFCRLEESSKLIRPIKASLCSIGIPADAFQRLSRHAGAVTPFANWGNIVKPGKNPPDGFHRRKNLLMNFFPAAQGRKPHGFSGSGAWYQVFRKTPPLVWRPDPALAGIITHYFPRRAILLICRVERVAAFLRKIS